ELTALQRITPRDAQRDLGSCAGRTADAHPASHQRGQHREEPLIDVLDRRGVLTVFIDVGATVEQVFARDANLVERQTYVIDAVEAALIPTMGNGDAGQRMSVVVADRHDKTMHPVALAAGDQLREHRGHVPVTGRIADVVFTGRGSWRMDHEFVRVRIERRGGLQALNIAAVPGFGHGETPASAQPDEIVYVGAMMSLRAQIRDGAAE